MVNLNEIAECINHPTLVKGKDVDAFKELAGKYPYTQLYSILYLKGLKDNNDIHFDEELVKHSFRIADRVQLYNLIKSEDEPVLDKEPSTALSVEEPADTAAVDENVDATRIESIEQMEVAEDEYGEKQIFEAENVEANNRDEVSPVIDKLEQDILHHAVTANYELPELSEEELQALEERKVESEARIEEHSSIEGDTEHVDINTKQSFNAWLKSDSHYHEEINLDKQAIDAIVNEFSEFDPSEKLFGEVERPKQEFFSPTKKAKESLKEDALPVSETLAKIYAAQGNYPKAINAYEQLILINPEKKSFFANLIKELKKKINEK